MSLASFLQSVNLWHSTAHPDPHSSHAVITSTDPSSSAYLTTETLAEITRRVPGFVFDDVDDESREGDGEFDFWEEFDDRPAVGKKESDSSKPTEKHHEAKARNKRQTTNNRPVNIFGLGFGINQGPGQDLRPPPEPATQPPPLTNQDVTFDDGTLDSLLQGNVNQVMNDAMNKLQASPEEMMKGVENFKKDAPTTTTEPEPTVEPTKTIIARYPDLIFHPDMTDLLMFIVGLLFSSIFFPALIGQLATFVRLDQLPLVLLFRPTLNGRSILSDLWSHIWGHAAPEDPPQSPPGT